MREQVLEYEPTYLHYVGGLSFLATVFLFRFVSPVLSRLTTRTYSNLTQYQQAEWNDRFISNVNAVIAIVLSSYSLLSEPGATQDLVWYRSPIAVTACAIIVGYMLADLLCMWIWCKTDRAEMLGYIIHHVTAAYAYYFVSVYGIFCHFAMLRLLAEASTVPVNLRWYLDTVGYERTRLIVVINGFLMLLTFFLFRIATVPIYWYHVWLLTGTEAVDGLGYIQHLMYIPSTVVEILNTYWFCKICRGFVKAFKANLKSRNLTINKNRFKAN